ncbi:MAG: tetratricopeptide repeat protein [Acidobacteriota bacterium]
MSALYRTFQPVVLSVVCWALTVLPCPASAQVELLPIPQVQLDDVERAVRDQLTAAREDLETRRGQLEGAELGTAYGHLGELYVIYDLAEAAEAALRNAIALQPESARWRYILGSILQLDRRLDEAAEQFQGALDQGASGAAQMRLAQIRLDQEQYDQARKLYEAARDLPEYAAAAAAGLGRVALDQGRPLEAIPLLERALQAQPRATALYYQLGRAYRAAGETERAREVLAKRGEGQFRFPDPIAMELQQSATGVGALLSLGRLSLSEGLLDVAEERFREAVAIDPESAAAHRSLAGVLQQSGRIDDALVSLERAIELEPDRAGVRYGAAQLLMNHPDPRGDRLERAIGHLQGALRQAPDFVPGLLDLANAQSRAGRAEEALTSVERALSLQPDSAGIRFQRAQLLADLDRTDDAVRAIAALEGSDDPALRSARARSDIARLMLRLGDAQGAAERYRALADDDALSNSERALSLSMLAQALAPSDPEAAIGALRDARRLEPRVPDLERNLGTLLGRVGRYGEAAEELLLVVEREPQRHDTRFAAAMALLFGERDAEARTVLEQGLALDPSQGPIAHLLARILVGSQSDSVRDGAAGLAIARKLFEARPSLDHAETVAMALAETGEMVRATEWQQRIVGQIESAGAEAPPKLLENARRRLQSYAAGEPARTPWLDR